MPEGKGVSAGEVLAAIDLTVSGDRLSAAEAEINARPTGRFFAKCACRR
jgi:hypothetical protein